MNPLVAEDPGTDPGCWGTNVMLVADAEGEFLALLRELQLGSGRTAGRIAAYSNGVLPRSTAYRFVSEKNRAMPQDRAQVKAFAEGCKLTPQGVNRVLQLWERLTDNVAPARQADNLVQDDVVDAELVPISQELIRRADTAVRRVQAADLVGVRSMDLVQDSSGKIRHDLADLGADLVVVHGDVNIHHTETHTHSEVTETNHNAGVTDTQNTGSDMGTTAADEPPVSQRERLHILRRNRFVHSVLSDPVLFRNSMVAFLVFAVVTLTLIAVLIPSRTTTGVAAALCVAAAGGMLLARAPRRR